MPSWTPLEGGRLRRLPARPPKSLKRPAAAREGSGDRGLCERSRVRESRLRAGRPAVRWREFPFAFLRAFGRKDVELQRLRKGNASDVPGGVLRRDSIHMATCAPGDTGVALAVLRDRLRRRRTG